MKKVMSVSVDERVIKLAKEGAYEARISFSQFVEEAIRLRVDAEILDGLNKKPVKEKLVVTEVQGADVESYEAKVENAKKQIDPPVDTKGKAISVPEKARLQAELDEKRGARDIKKDRLAAGRDILAKEPTTNLMGVSGSYSKEHQTRKKGKKTDSVKFSDMPK
jgi:hypothetical protein